MQVRIVGVLRMDVPVMGPFEMTFDKITAPGFFRLDEKVDAKRTYASWFIDSETGEIIRQIPPREMLNLLKQLEEISGIIYHNHI